MPARGQARGQSRQHDEPDVVSQSAPGAYTFRQPGRHQALAHGGYADRSGDARGGHQCAGKEHGQPEPPRAEADGPQRGGLGRRQACDSRQHEGEHRQDAEPSDHGQGRVAVALQVERVDHEHGGRGQVGHAGGAFGERGGQPSRQLGGIHPVDARDEDCWAEHLGTCGVEELGELHVPRLPEPLGRVGQWRGPAESEVVRVHAHTDDRHRLADEADGVDEREPAADAEPSHLDEELVDDDLVDPCGIRMPAGCERRAPDLLGVAGSEREDHPTEEVLAPALGDQVAVAHGRGAGHTGHPASPCRDVTGGIDRRHVEGGVARTGPPVQAVPGPVRPVGTQAGQQHEPERRRGHDRHPGQGDSPSP